MGYAFQNTGVDYFGPFYSRVGRASVKRYGCLFTCLATRAVHIELTYDLTAEGFKCALVRMIARRGKPHKLLSDNGRNLTGCERELKEVVAQLGPAAASQMRDLGIEWEFNVPYASHMGGVWERLIRSARHHLRILCGNTVVSDEVLRTFFCQAEAALNDRPLTAASADARDPEPLSPNQILLLRCVDYSTPGESLDVLARKASRRAECLYQQFWVRMLADYLPDLQQRSKWTTRKQSLKVGDLVMMGDDLKAPKGQWPLARVSEICESAADGLVRSVVVYTGGRYRRSKGGAWHFAAGAYKKRPVAKLCLLEAAVDGAEVALQSRRAASKRTSKT